jgi:hypothetical protein
MGIQNNESRNDSLRRGQKVQTELKAGLSRHLFLRLREREREGVEEGEGGREGEDI